MDRKGLWFLSFALVLGALASAPLAQAGTFGHWTRVTGVGGHPARLTDQVGLERTADGVLHVAWTREGAGNSTTLLHSAISANGKTVTGPNAVITSNDGLNNSVDLLGAPGGGLRVLFAGLFPLNPGIDRVMSTATAPSSGTSWSGPSAVSRNAVGQSAPVYVGAGIGAAVDNSGTVISTWGDSGPGDGGYHVGLSPAVADVHFPVSCCSIDPNVAVDSSSGTTLVAWNSQHADHILYHDVAGGPTKSVPKSAAFTPQQRVGISGRIGAPGIFVAYGSGSNQFEAVPAWWRVGAEKFHFLAGRKGALHMGLAPAPNGRLWLFWSLNDRIEAVRTGPQPGSIGGITSIKLPSGANIVYQLSGEGSRGSLDLLALTNGNGGVGYFHQRIKPRLRIDLKSAKVHRGGNAVFRVSDGGPVTGAKVKLKVGGQTLSGTTGANSKVTIHIPANAPKGKRTAIASKAGYLNGQKTIQITG